MMTRLPKITALIIAIESLVAHAESPKDIDFSFDAHVHGRSELTLAMEGKSLQIELSSPAMNLTGFEHKAITKKDIAAIENAALILDKPDQLFLISGGRCTLINTYIDISDVIESNNEEHETKSEDQARKHQHGNNDQPNSHSEINAIYHYHCDDISELSSMTVVLFEKFPGIHQIHAIWIKEKQQGGATLNTEDNMMDFK